MNLENKCLHYEASRKQREEEIKRYGNDDGCDGYKFAGCYTCNGHDDTCKKYISINKIKKLEISFYYDSFNH